MKSWGDEASDNYQLPEFGEYNQSKYLTYEYVNVEKQERQLFVWAELSFSSLIRYHKWF